MPKSPQASLTLFLPVQPQVLLGNRKAPGGVWNINHCPGTSPQETPLAVSSCPGSVRMNLSASVQLARSLLLFQPGPVLSAPLSASFLPQSLSLSFSLSRVLARSLPGWLFALGRSRSGPLPLTGMGPACPVFADNHQGACKDTGAQLLGP